MKHIEETERLFQQVLDETLPAIKQQVEWFYAIADGIDESLHRRGMTRKNFAKLVGTSEAAVSSRVGGSQNFTLSTLAKISAVLGKPIKTINCRLPTMRITSPC